MYITTQYFYTLLMSENLGNPISFRDYMEASWAQDSVEQLSFDVEEISIKEGKVTLTWTVLETKERVTFVLDKREIAENMTEFNDLETIHERFTNADIPDERIHKELQWKTLAFLVRVRVKKELESIIISPFSVL